MGSYETMVYSHNLKKEIVFGLEFDEKAKFNITYNYIENDLKRNSNHFDGFSCIKSVSVNSYSNDFSYFFDNKYNGESDSKTKDFYFKVADINNIGSKKIKDKEILEKILNSFLFSAEDDLPIPKGISIDGEEHLRIWNSLKEKDLEDDLYNIYHFINTNISRNSNFLKEYLKKISYLGPLRSNPKRYYSVDSEFEISVGKEGENIAFFFKNKSFIAFSVN